MGTEVTRGISQSVWFDKGIDTIRSHMLCDGGCDAVIVTDCRFSNENRAMFRLAYEFGFPYKTIEVMRPSLKGGDLHVSETGYADFSIQYEVTNDKDLDFLNTEATRIIDDLFGPCSDSSHAAICQESVLTGV